LTKSGLDDYPKGLKWAKGYEDPDTAGGGKKTYSFDLCLSFYPLQWSILSIGTAGHP